MQTITLRRKVILKLVSTLSILVIVAVLFPQALPIQRAFAAIVDAVNDNFTASPIDGVSGGSTTTVFINDTLDGLAFTPTDVTPSIIADGGLTGVAINGDGTLTVLAGTPASDYVVTYQICEVAPPNNCDTANATVRVLTMNAVNDNFSGSPINGIPGGTTASVFSNDLLDGAAFASGDVTASISADGGLTGVTISASGLLNIPAGSAANTYTVTYQICENATPINCDTADATVVVVQVGINAVNDNFSGSPINTATGGTTTTVFANDTIDGASFGSGAVTATISADGGLTGVTISSGGVLSIPVSTPVNTYTVTYEICQTATPADCDTADVTVVVIQFVINAVNDNFSANAVNGVSGGSTPTVFSNDTLNGFAFLNGFVIPSIAANGGLTGVSINPSGTISVPAGSAANTYTVTYQICETASPTNCDTATVTVNVITINAVNNNFTSTPIDGIAGGQTSTVFNNDTLNGSAFSNAAVIPTISADGGLTGVTISANGRLNVPAGTADGTYTVTYQICETANPTNCDTANATIRVGLDPTITKSRSRSSAVPGDTIVYTIVVRNPRPTSLTNVEVFDPLDNAVDYVTSTTTRGTRSYSSSAHEVTFAIGTMAAGTSVTLTITVRVDSGATRPSTIVNDAVVDTTQTGLIDSNTVNVSIPAASSSATATPRPAATATPSSGTPGELPETGEQPPQDIRTLWGGFLILGISLMIFVGLAALLILYLRDEAKFIDTFRRKGRWALLGLALTFLVFVVLMNIKPAIEQSAEVQPTPSNAETADQSPGIESLLGLLPGQLVDQPSATSTNVPETQSADESLPQATRLIVPVLNLETDLVEARIVNGKWDVSQLAAGVAHLEKTAHPGTKGNAVYAGHVLTKRGIGPFYNLIKMDAGDIIIAEAEGVTYIYEVEWVKVVSPTDIEVASPADTPVITLLTCTKWNGETRKYDSRLAVRARLVDTIRDKLSETGIQ